MTVDIFNTQTNILYVMHTGSLMRRFVNSDDANWEQSIMENPIFSKTDERIKTLL